MWRTRRKISHLCSMPFQESELIIDEKGQIYHIGLKPEEVADHIVLVGDPARVSLVANHLESIEVQKAHREFVSVTGTYQGTRVTVLSTGIGTDNIEIVMNEIDAVKHIDFESRELKKEVKLLRVIRLGTCGAIQPEIHPGDLIFSTHGFGTDPLWCYYAYNPNEDALFSALKAYIEEHLAGFPPFYLVEYQGNWKVDETVHRGITLTAPGFYGPQGRQLGRLRLRFPNLVETLSAFRFNDFRFTNIEMECSALYLFSQLLDYESATLCVALVNRHHKKRIKNLADTMEKLIETGLRLLVQKS